MKRAIRKLLFVSDAPHFGGAERYVANMTAAAQRRGIAVAVCWARSLDAHDDVFAEARRHGATVRIIEPHTARSLPAFTRGLQTVIQLDPPDAIIINACGRPRFWAVPWIARLAGIPSLWVHHMVDQHDYRRLPPDKLGGRMEGLHLWRWPQALRHRLAATASTAVVALNPQDRLQIAREQCVRTHRIHVVRNGIDTEHYQFDAHARLQTRHSWSQNLRWDVQEAFIVGTAGRLVHGKGTEMLMQAVADLRTRGLPLRLAVAGEGPDRDRLSSIAHRLRITDSVALLGHYDNMPGFYSGLDAFALCSNTESFGLVLAEAMSCERAVVATPTAGARMQIANGLTGAVLDSFSATELAESLLRLQQQPRLREELGRNARRRVCRESSIDAALERTLGVFASCGHLNPEKSPTLAVVSAIEEAA